MKKILLSIILLLVISFVVFNFVIRKPEKKIFSNNPPPISVPNPILVDYQDIKYQVYLQKIPNPKFLNLIPNFTEKKLSKTIMEDEKCMFGANAGFYTKDDKPLGYFFANEKFLNNNIHSKSFLNGFIFLTKQGLFDLSTELPEKEKLKFIFQSGPVFTPKSNLKITDDKPARRILIGKTGTGNFYFIAVTEEENKNSGPYLASLPAVIQKFNSQPTTPNTQLATLINLDGGSASAFYDETGTMLQEITPVGSFLCYKK